jgi:hypothetical protein
LFTDVNKVEFAQQYVPIPSTGGKFWGFTNTITTALWVNYIKVIASDDIISRLNNWCLQRGIEFPGPSASTMSSLKKRWCNGDSWHALFPGIGMFVSKRASRNQNLRFGYYAVMNTASIKALFYKLSSKTARLNGGFNSISWRSHIDLNQQVDLSDLLGVREQFDESFPRGSSSIIGYKGILDVESMLREEMVIDGISVPRLKTGIDCGRKFLDNRVVIGIDCGLKNLAGITATLGTLDHTGKVYSGNMIKHLVSTASYYSDCRVTELCNQKFSQPTDDRDRFKTMFAEEFRDDLAGFAEFEMVDRNVSAWSRAEFAQQQRRKQRYWSRFSNMLFGIVDRLHREAGVGLHKPPVIIFGNSLIRPMSGHKTVPSSWLMRRLATQFAVVSLDEHFTSQKCPKCCGQMDSHGFGCRLKACANAVCSKGHDSFIVNRDIAAPQNMTTIFVCLLIYGMRPRPFAPKLKS